MRIYYLVADCGDGSCSVEFFRTLDMVEQILDPEECDYETYGCNEGNYGSFVMPDAAVEASGIRFEEDSPWRD